MVPTLNDMEDYHRSLSENELQTIALAFAGTVFAYVVIINLTKFFG